MPLTIWNCVLSYKQMNYFSENRACSSMTWLSKQNSQVATFCYPPFQQVANGIFRWQICYLLLLISNPGMNSDKHKQHPFCQLLLLVIRNLNKDKHVSKPKPYPFSIPQHNNEMLHVEYRAHHPVQLTMPRSYLGSLNLLNKGTCYFFQLIIISTVYF